MRVDPGIRGGWWAALAGAFVLGGLIPVRAQASVNYWLPNYASQYWENPANWYLGSPTDPGNDLYINFGQYLSNIQQTTIASGNFVGRNLYTNSDLSILGGSLDLSGDSSTVQGAVSVSGGRLTVGKLTSENLYVAANATIEGNFSLNSTLVTSGSFTLNGNVDILAGSASLSGTASGSHYIRSRDLVATNFRGDALEVLNAGTFSGVTLNTLVVGEGASSQFLGAQSTIGNLPVDGTVSMDTQQGVKITGSMNLNSGSHVQGDFELVGGLFSAASGSAGYVNLVLTHGAQANFEAGSDVAVGSLQLAGETTKLSSDKAQSIDSLQWTAGEIGAAELVADNLSISGPGKKILGQSASLRLNGTGTWGSGNVDSATSGSDDATFINEAESIFNVTGIGTWKPGTFANRGLLNKSGQGSTIIEALFANSGLVHVTDGTLDLRGGGMQTGAFHVDGSGTLLFNPGAGGSFSLDQGSSVSGSATVSSGELGIFGSDLSEADLNVRDAGTLYQLSGSSQIHSLLLDPTGTLDLQDSTSRVADLRNLRNGELSNGVYKVHNSVLSIQGPISTNNASIILSGDGAIRYGDGRDALTGLTTNNGILHILGQNQAFSSLLNNAGEIYSAGENNLSFDHGLANSGRILLETSSASISGGSNISGLMEADEYSSFRFLDGVNNFLDQSVLIGRAVLQSGEFNFFAGSDFNDAIIDNVGGQVFFRGGTSAVLGTLNLNQGTFNVVGNTRFNNRVRVGGEVQLNSSNLTFAGGGESSGSIFAQGSSNVSFASGEFDLNDGSKLFGSMSVDGATVNANNKSKIVGTIDILTGIFNYRSGADTSASKYVVRNDGTLNVQSGSLQISDFSDNWDAQNRVLSGGKIHVFDGATLTFGMAGVITNRANVWLSGQNANFNIFSQRNGDTSALGSLRENGGDITLENGANASIEDSVNNTGTFNLNAASVTWGGGVTNSGQVGMRNGSTGDSGDNVNNTGTFLVGASTLTINGDYNQTAGRTTLEDNGTITAHNFNIIGGEFSGTGNLDSSVNNTGTMSPGQSPGKVKITGDYLQGATGKMILEIAGTMDSDFDQIKVLGQGHLNGSLTVRFLGGFKAKEGQSWQMLTFDGGLFGQFSSVTFENANVPLALSYGPNSLRINAVPEPASIAAIGVGLAVLVRRRRRCA
ncbi:MAG: PEP-CTERM sorting domain-containing protein [Armatimonadetes bacterium]|nr:PEP-CTERM sorting domain-containing protein [Armatimonadota bacterium]